MSGGIPWLTLPAGYLGSSFIGACLIACGFNTNASKIASIVLAVFFLFTLWWARRSWMWAALKYLLLSCWYRWRRTWVLILGMTGLVLLFWFVGGGVALRYFVSSAILDAFDVRALNRRTRSSSLVSCRACIAYGILSVIVTSHLSLYIDWTPNSSFRWYCRTKSQRLRRLSLCRHLRMLPIARFVFLCYHSITYPSTFSLGCYLANSSFHILCPGGHRRPCCFQGDFFDLLHFNQSDPWCDRKTLNSKSQTHHTSFQSPDRNQERYRWCQIPYWHGLPPSLWAPWDYTDLGFLSIFFGLCWFLLRWWFLTLTRVRVCMTPKNDNAL